MKNLLEHKKESTKITVLPDWEKVYKDLREILEVPEDWECNSEKFVKSDIDDECPFEIQFLDFFIRDFLKLTGPIWNNVFYFQRKGVKPAGYHGSLSGQLVVTWDFVVLGRREVLQKLNGLDIYDNLEDVNKFMDLSNKTYMKLIEIQRYFPAEINIDWDVC